MRYRRNTEETNFWAGYADCMLALFMIALVMWILSAGVTAFRDADTGNVIGGLLERIAELEKENKLLQDENQRLKEELEKSNVGALKSELAKLEEELRKLKQEKNLIAEELRDSKLKLQAINTKLGHLKAWHASYLAEAGLDEENKAKEVQRRVEIAQKISNAEYDGAEVIDDLLKELNELRLNNQALLEENERVLVEIKGTGETFDSGKATIGARFRQDLQKEGGAFDEMARKLQTKNKDAVVLEIIGHTDGEPISTGKGNLDDELPKFYLADNFDFAGLKAGSNNDLGLMRALAIKQEWEAYVAANHADTELLEFEVVCYSAGQMQPAGKAPKNLREFKQANKESRRIEMRLRNKGKDN